MSEPETQSQPNPQFPHASRSPKKSSKLAAGKKASSASSSKKSTTAAGTPSRRKPALPQILNSLIDSYVEAGSTEFQRINKGKLTAAVQRKYAERLAAAAEAVLEAFVESNADGLLGPVAG